MPSYVRASSVVSRVIAGETLIVPVRGGVGDLASIYSLNEVASSGRGGSWSGNGAGIYPRDHSARPGAS